MNRKPERPTALEYGIVAALIAVAAVSAMKGIESKRNEIRSESVVVYYKVPQG